MRGLGGGVFTFGTWGLNSTALCIASTAFISAVLKPRLDAVSGENLSNKTTTCSAKPVRSGHSLQRNL